MATLHGELTALSVAWAMAAHALVSRPDASGRKVTNLRVEFAEKGLSW